MELRPTLIKKHEPELLKILHKERFAELRRKNAALVAVAVSEPQESALSQDDGKLVESAAEAPHEDDEALLDGGVEVVEQEYNEENIREFESLKNSQTHESAFGDLMEQTINTDFNFDFPESF